MEKYCKNCGAKLDEGENFCSNCGAKVEEELNNTTEIAENNENINDKKIPTDNIQTNTNNAPVKTSGFAIASFVCSIGGILIAGIILGTLGICFSITAKERIKTFSNEKGEGLATAGLIIGIIDIVFVVIGLILKHI